MDIKMGSEQNIHIEPEHKSEIKNILLMVDALEASYEKRLQDLQTEYQADIDQMLAMYKEERQQFDMMRELQEQQISKLTEELADAHKLFKKEFVEHKITRDRLNSVLSKLQAEKELLAVTKDRIASAKLKITQPTEDPIDELHEQTDSDNNEENKSSSRFARTKNLFRQVISGNIAKPITVEAQEKTKEQQTKSPSTASESKEDGFSY